MKSQIEVEAVLQKVSQRMMHLSADGVKEQFPVSLVDMDCWEWPQGVGLFGLWCYYRKSGKPDVRAFIESWFDRQLPSIARVERNVNTSSPMLTLTYLYEETPKKEYRALIESWLDWVMNPQGLLRTGDGCFQHMITGDPNQGEILIDTLFMVVLFMVRAAKLLGRQDALDEANFQVLAHVEYLYDKGAALFYHGWNFDRNSNYGKVHWLRGNSWFTAGIFEIVDQQPDIPQPLKRLCMTLLNRQLGALQSWQDEASGLWRTVVDDADSYIELSGSAAVLYGAMRGVRAGVISRETFEPLIARGLKGIWKYIEEDGTVLNVSYGTPIGNDAEFYKRIPCRPMTYGQAMTLLLLQEALDPAWAHVL